MSSEAVAKSVAGSLFHTCATDLQKVNRAVQVLQILIDDFGVSNMFGSKNIQYFADMTRTGIRVREKYKYEYKGSAPCKYCQFHLSQYLCMSQSLVTPVLIAVLWFSYLYQSQKIISSCKSVNNTVTIV